MNKRTIRVIISILVILLLIPSIGLAQDKDGPNTVLCVTNTRDYKEGNTLAELDSIATLWNDNVIKKNKYIIMQFVVTHYYGANSGDFLVITEYNGSGLAIIEEARKETNKIYKEWMKDAEDRKAFNALFTKYFKPYHSDEIYALFSKVSH